MRSYRLRSVFWGGGGFLKKDGKGGTDTDVRMHMDGGRGKMYKSRYVDLEFSEEFVGEVLLLLEDTAVFAYICLCGERGVGRGKDETGMIVWDQSNMLGG